MAGKVTDSVICRTDGSQSYALYLPAGYSSSRKFPCIYFFDAHARGAQPVKTYRELAEKYGFVLIGSNTSKNATPRQVTNSIISTLLEDSRSRINIDPKRIYTAGFSGGSRIASSVAIENGGVAGVIGCAAGFPRVQQIPNKFDYFGMVGDQDFNLTEMKQLDETLGRNGFTHQLLTSGAMHGWASIADFNAAMLWLQVNGMKENIQPRNDTIIAAFIKEFDGRISAAKQAHDVIGEHELTDGIIRTVDGLADMSLYNKALAVLSESIGYKKAISDDAQLQQTEQRLQQELANQFTTRDEKWWDGAIKELKQHIRHTKTPEESKMNARLLNYLGLIGYLSSSQALNAGDLGHAETYLHIFKMVDPENPDCPYLTAVFYMKKGDQQHALEALTDAATLGYSEVSQVGSEPAFTPLRDEPGFMRTIEKIKSNYQAL